MGGGRCGGGELHASLLSLGEREREREREERRERVREKGPICGKSHSSTRTSQLALGIILLLPDLILRMPA